MRWTAGIGHAGPYNLLLTRKYSERSEDVHDRKITIMRSNHLALFAWLSQHVTPPAGTPPVNPRKARRSEGPRACIERLPDRGASQRLYGAADGVTAP